MTYCLPVSVHSGFCMQTTTIAPCLVETGTQRTTRRVTTVIWDKHDLNENRHRRSSLVAVQIQKPRGGLHTRSAAGFSNFYCLI